MFTNTIESSNLMSTLEVPDGRNPDQNAWLTLTLRYSLNFADSKNLIAGVIEKHGSKFAAVDSDQKRLPIVDWDLASQMKFQRAFQRGENIWNWQFVLITPQDFDGLDYTCIASGWVVRPNVLCLFRLVPNAANAHLRITVVRLDPSVTSSNSFRSNKALYDHLDVWCPTLGHELGHALGLPHIKELLGDAQCIADAKRGIYPDRCYGETDFEVQNIMGGGTRIYLDNARPWVDRMADHTSLAKSAWKPTGIMTMPPRKIPLGVAQVAKPKFF
jgi:hypothetical protein